MEIEIEIQELRNNIEVTNYRNRIRDLEVRINNERKKLQPDVLDDLNEMIGTLKEFTPIVQSEIDRHYYFCYEYDAVEVTQIGSVLVYIVREERFRDYLRDQYGQEINPGNVGTLEFRIVDIFG